MKKIIIFGLIFFILCPFVALAQTDPGVRTMEKGYFLEEGLEIKKPTLEVNIPGLNFSDANLDTDERGYILIPWLNEYISTIYKFGVATGSIVAVVIIIIAGAQIILSGGGDQKIAAYKRIGQVVVGLFILWGSYAGLYAINPNLVIFQPLKTRYILTENINEDLGQSITEADANSAEVLAGTLPGLTPIPNSGNLQGGNRLTLPQVKAALEKVAGEYSNKIYITSAYRTPAEQYTMMVKYCDCPKPEELPNDVAKGNWAPYCSIIKETGKCNAMWKPVARSSGQFVVPLVSHLGGRAIDASTGNSYVKCEGQNENVKKSSGVSNNSSTKPADMFCIPEEQQKFIKAMLKNGFCVGLKNGGDLREPWHFEFMEGGKVSGFCTNDLNDANLKKLFYLSAE